MSNKRYSLPSLDPTLTVCENGCLHLHLGPASLHLPEHGVRDLAELLQGYVEALDARRVQQDSRDPHLH